MSEHHQVNLRASYARVSPDPDEQEAYEAEVERARAHQKTLGHRFSVAPRQSLLLHDGTRLRAGEEVRVSNFRIIRDVAPWQQLERLVDVGIVLEADIPPEDADVYGASAFERDMRSAGYAHRGPNSGPDAA